MGIFDSIKNFFSKGKSSPLIEIYLEDKKCGKQMKLIFRKSYDIQKVYEDQRQAAYEIKKVAVCDQCYNKIDLEIEFDKHYKKIKESVVNGKIITKEEYESNE
ncbi:hypothetical protein [Halanaerobium hydrogeniformans]|uniref:Uncharacterized protein n=1 Tax=Halanaerobium hydrogeniformans TaxID=656519 RepID=E4RLP7_HALHG|nr:hypothetical protein [Halanaerobium hydrogeniformans]ADQ14961.1 hypothetical protein Halsa_1536 [Halanaerobium hydrogeniformans]